MTAFLSYAHQDAESAESLRADLERLAVPVWIDKSLVGGQRWWDEILRQIRGCDMFVLLVTAYSLQSEACVTEWAYAAALNRPFLPLRADTVDWMTAPVEMRQTQLIDFRPGHASSFAALSKSVRTIALPVELPDSIPSPPAAPLSYRDRFAKLFAPMLPLDDQVDYFGRLTFDLGGVNQTEALDLLYRLHDRTDLSWTVRSNIDKILAEHPGARQSPPSARLLDVPLTTATPDSATSEFEPAPREQSLPAFHRRRRRVSIAVTVTVVVVGVAFALSVSVGAVVVVVAVAWFAALVAKRHGEPPTEPRSATPDPSNPAAPEPAPRPLAETTQVWQTTRPPPAVLATDLPSVDVGTAWWNRVEATQANTWVAMSPTTVSEVTAGGPLPPAGGTSWWKQHQTDGGPDMAPGEGVVRSS